MLPCCEGSQGGHEWKKGGGVWRRKLRVRQIRSAAENVEITVFLGSALSVELGDLPDDQKDCRNETSAVPIPVPSAHTLQLGRILPSAKRK